MSDVRHADHWLYKRWMSMRTIEGDVQPDTHDWVSNLAPRVDWVQDESISLYSSFGATGAPGAELTAI